MSTELVLNEARVKVRNPWAVWGLAIITLGIYTMYWYYSINRELRDYGRTASGNPDHIEVDPWMSLIAITLGTFLIVPPFVTLWRTGSRIARARSIAGASGMSMGAWFVFAFIPGFNIFFNVFAQYQLNAVWNTASTSGSANRAAAEMPSAISVG